MTAQSVVFDRAADFYDETRGFPPGVAAQAAETIVAAGALSSASRIVEIGVGTGRIALPLAAHVGAIVGLDLSAAMMERLRLKRTTEPVYLVRGDAGHLPFATGVFDGAVAVHVFHLIPHWQQVIAELGRVLRPGAPLIHCWSEQDEVFQDIMAAWRAALPPSFQSEVGVRFERNATMLEELGWRPARPIQTLTYTVERTPMALRDMMKNRIWSQTWRLSESELAHAIHAVDRALHTDYPDPEQPQQVTARFHAAAYLAPA